MFLISRNYTALSTLNHLCQGSAIATWPCNSYEEVGIALRQPRTVEEAIKAVEQRAEAVAIDSGYRGRLFAFALERI
jgi:hypothetical protein